MLASMTAFARAETTDKWGSAILEIRTVNHRYLDISIRLPDELRALESLFRTDIQERLKRGKVDCTLRTDSGNTDSAELPLNRELASRLIQAANSLDIDNPQPINPMDIIRWPGVINRETVDIDAMGRIIRALLKKTLDSLIETRVREGAKIREMILDRCNGIDTQIILIKSRLPEITAGIRVRYQQRLQEILANTDNTRLEQELLLLAQKMDVAEELDRLETHVAEVRRVLDQDEPIGRRLDFLMQEMNREANTLSSKSVHTDTTGASVELKVLIEQMREQIQNIE
jgi:uncharacterized protein (TIGR00255 family)